MPHSWYFLGPALPVFRSRIGVHHYPLCRGEDRITTREWTRCYAYVRKHGLECFKVSPSFPHRPGAAPEPAAPGFAVRFVSRRGHRSHFPICILVLPEFHREFHWPLITASAFRHMYGRQGFPQRRPVAGAAFNCRMHFHSPRECFAFDQSGTDASRQNEVFPSRPIHSRSEGFHSADDVPWALPAGTTSRIERPGR